MKKDYYFWIFIVVSLVVCGSLLLTIFKMDNVKSNKVKQVGSLENNISKEEEKKEVIIEKTDLTQDDVDFEEDPSDLADDFIDDGSFDESINLDSIENEIN